MRKSEKYATRSTHVRRLQIRTPPAWGDRRPSLWSQLRRSNRQSWAQLHYWDLLDVLQREGERVGSPLLWSWGLWGHSWHERGLPALFWFPTQSRESKRKQAIIHQWGRAPSHARFTNTTLERSPFRANVHLWGLSSVVWCRRLAFGPEGTASVWAYAQTTTQCMDVCVQL